MLVSVIIPVYNGEKYLNSCIDSVLNQTLERGKYQVIVVNDGSSDGTREILKEYGNKITIVTNSHNHGIAYTLNEGIGIASGEWIKWLSADDEMLPNCLETLLKHATDHNTIYYTHYHIIDAKGQRIRDFVEPGRPASDLWARYFGNGSSSIIHSDVFNKCGLFDDTLKFGEDYEFWLRATMVYDVNITLIPEFTVNYRNHPDQLTNKVGGGNDRIIKDKIKGQVAARKTLT